MPARLARTLIRACYQHARNLSSAASQQATSPGHVFQQRITPAVCSSLHANGFAVLDNVLPSPEALREEVMSLYRAGLMHDNCTHLVKDGKTSLLQKHHIHEAELTLDPEIQARAPLCAQLNADRTLPVMLSLFMPQLQLDTQAIKLQVNSGSSGCFPMHFDTDESLDGRKVTCIFYLNPGWKEKDGGALRLYPFPQRPPVDIAPLHNRIVLFSSARMLHRVMPSSAPERVCFTIWLSQSRPRLPATPSLAAASSRAKQLPGGAAAFLLQPHVRKHVTKLVYAEEWAKSVEESHPSGPARDEAIKRHWDEVEIIRKALGEHRAAIDALAAGMEQQQQAGVPKVAWF